MKPDGFHLRLCGPDRSGDGCTSATGQFRITDEFQQLCLGPRLRRIDLGRRGMLLGTLFDSQGRHITTAPPGDDQRWCDTGGQLLIERYWGSYLAILRTGDRVTILRDPSGSFPCYWMTQGNDLMLASDSAWAGDAGFRFAGIDWDEIRAQLQFRNRHSARTALVGVQELLPGCSLEIGPEGVQTRCLWTPYAHAHWTGRERFTLAAGSLRPVIERTVAAQAALYARPLIALSGGLDSSIVAACVAQAQPAAECLVFRGGDADLDETGYAATVADRLGLPLHSAALAWQAVDLQHSSAADLPVPVARSFSQADDRAAQALAERLGADAFFLGNGGDNILWYFNTVTAAIDRLRGQGLRAALDTTRDIARMCDVPLAEALRRVWAGRRQHRLPPWGTNFLYLSGSALIPATTPVHPWDDAPPGTPLGVQAYVRSLIRLQDHHAYFDRSAFAPVHAPLTAQPIVEACLAIPSWLWSRCGQNRAVARAAFRDVLPSQIVARQSKGGFDGFVQEALIRHREVLQTMLLEGHLARHGLIDRVAIEAETRAVTGLSGPGGARLHRLVAVEAWLEAQRLRGRWSG